MANLNKAGIPVIKKSSDRETKKSLSREAVSGSDVRPSDYAVTIDGEVIQVKDLGEEIVEVVFQTKAMADKYVAAPFM